MHSNSTYYRHSELLSNTLIYFVAFFIISAVIWLKKEFGEVTIDQILYHLQYGADGLMEADQEVIRTFMTRCLLIPFLLATLVTLITHGFHRDILHLLKKCKHLVVTFVTQFHIGQKLFSIRPRFLVLSVAIIYALVNFSVFSYAWDTLLPNSTDFYAEHYVNPAQIKLTVGKPRNLVLIYVESLEATYADKKIFRENLLHSISAETLDGTSFTKERQIPGTGWTMAGIVATQCGIPLRPSLGGGDERKNVATGKVATFLPNIECLGDILKKQGYKNVFMGGASLSFAGKGKFFTTHGYDEAYGRDEFNKTTLGKLPQNHWGLFDDVLFTEAKKKIDALESSQQPYNLTMLTLDTHGPTGSFSETCLARGAVQFYDIVRCTTNMLSELVAYMDNKGYLDNTTVVIMGDHLVMENTVSRKLQKAPERFVFNTYITRGISLKKNREEITHVDHLPTILDSLNIKVAGGKLGLGVSGFYEGKVVDSMERFELLNANVTRTSKKYLSFWDKKGKTNMD